MKGKRFLILGAAVLVLAGLGVWKAGLFSSGDAFRGERVANADSYVLRFDDMNRTDSHSLSLEQGDSLEVVWSIVRGTIAVSIGQADKAPIYRGDLNAADFSLLIPEPGQYTITVSAQDAEGYLYINPAVKLP